MGVEEEKKSGGPPTPDPRSTVVYSDTDTGVVRIAGSRCRACAYPNVEPLLRCPLCGAECDATEFGPGAVVFAATVLRVPVPGRQPPYGLAYVDLDDGPRILAHVDRTDSAATPDQRVRLVGQTPEGDPLVTLEDIS